MPGDVSFGSIEFTIKGNADKASASIDRLIGNLSQLNTALSNSANLAKASSGLRSLGDALKGIGGIKALTAAFALRELGKAADSLKGFKSAATAMKSISKVSENPEALADAASWLSQIALIDFTNIEVAAQGIKDIAASTRTIGNIKPVSEEIKRTGEAAKKADSPLKSFLSSLKRIAFYRIIRSVIKSITEAFREGLKNAYEFSKLTGGALSQALDTISTKSLTMKNQLGAAFGGLLTALTPIILTAINLITKLAAAITRLIAILGGGSQWMKAKDVWTEWGDAAAGAGGAAKEALRYLAPFDELNRLPDANKGGGGGGSATDYGDMFEWVSTEEGAGLSDALTEAFQGIADFFETHDWSGLADSFWEGLKNSFSNRGKATEVISALFEALGAAIGAASAFVGELCRNIVEDIATSFKQNLVDYNGDGKISITEFLGAVLITGMDAYEGIKTWIKSNMIDPFIDGFAKAIGLSGKEALYDAIVNFGIDIRNWFIREVFNPIISAWNDMVDNMPQWLQDAISKLFGVDSLKIPLIGEVEHVNSAGVTESERIVKNMTAGLTKVSDQIPLDKKTVTVQVNRKQNWTTSFKKWISGRDDGNLYGLTEMISRKTDWNTPFKKWISGRDDGNLYGLTEMVSRKQGWTSTFRKWISNRDDGKLFGLVEMISRETDWKNTFKKWISGRDDGKLFGLTEMISRAQGWTTTFREWISGRRDGQLFGLTEMIDLGRNGWSTVSSWVQNSFMGDIIGKAVNLIRNNWGTVYSWITEKYFGSDVYKNIGLTKAWSTVHDWVSQFIGDAVDIVANLINPSWKYGTPTMDVNASVKGGGTSRALGGVYNNGVWRDIPQYASGTANAHGSLFVAGEAGPEVVGHIGGRTEVLNKSQIASAIYSATRSAMSNASMDNGVSEETMYRAFSRALADSDLGGDIELDGETLYRAMVNRNRANTRTTGVNAMA